MAACAFFGHRCFPYSRYESIITDYISELIEKKDRQMRFRNSKDPIYGAFNIVDNQSISRLFVEFIKDISFNIKTAIKKMSEETI